MNREQLVAIIQSGHITDGDLADAILSKLNSAKPVAVIITTGQGDQLDWDTDGWDQKWPSVPLYLHPPAPAPSAVNVSLTDEGKTNQLADFIHRFKRHVGGDGEFWLHELEDFYFGEVSAARSEE